MSGQQGKKKGGSKKYGRNRRGVTDQALSKYVRGKIDFATYWRRTNGISFDKIGINLK